MKTSRTESGRKRVELHSPLDLHDTIHELSMSDNAIEACFGRGLKVLLPPLETWLSAEQERNTDLETIAHTSTNVVAQLLSATGQALGRGGCHEEVMRLMLRHFTNNFNDHIAEAAKHDKEWAALEQAKSRLVETIGALLSKEGQQAQ